LQRLHPIGSGFAGFWYHLGFFTSQEANFDRYDYYCYSSGCLSLVIAHLNTSVDSAYDACQEIQIGWLNGTLSRYDLVNHFLEKLVPESKIDGAGWQAFLSRLNILVTTAGRGAEVLKARDRDDLVDLLVKTTWIPLVTGNGILQKDGEHYLDGGFSRVLHPPCHQKVQVPNTFATAVYTLHPGLDREAAFDLWHLGRSAEALS
jgi:hypothetical protein